MQTTTCLIATVYRGSGAELVSLGSALLFISALEIVLRKRPLTYEIISVGVWAGRFFVILVWLLMIWSGLHYLKLVP